MANIERFKKRLSILLKNCTYGAKSPITGQYHCCHDNSIDWTSGVSCNKKDCPLLKEKQCQNKK